MLTTDKVKQVEKMLAEGKLSQRKIATAVGVSRNTIRAIAAGERPDYDARRRENAMEVEPLRIVERCPTCGGRVYIPCRLCRLRTGLAREQAVLKELRRLAREQAVKRLLRAILRAAAQEFARNELPELDATAGEPAA